MKLWISILVLSLVGGCASYDGRGLQPGTANLDDVIHVMGQPAQRWQNADGSIQLAYPRGPMGVHTFMALLGADGKLKSIQNVLEKKTLSRIEQGMTEAQVLRILGPSEPSWTVYYARRDELAWEWRYCNELRQPSRFDVLFDASKGVVRSTLDLTESQLSLCGKTDCIC